MIYKFTEEFEIEADEYYAILLKEDEDYISCGIVLGSYIPEYRERFAKYYLTQMRTPKCVEDLVKDL